MDSARAANFQESVEIVFLIAPFERADRQETLEAGVGPRTLPLGCTPIINLTAHHRRADPDGSDQVRVPVSPDFRHHRVQEVFSVDEVTCIYEKTGETVKFEPFFVIPAQHAAEGCPLSGTLPAGRPAPSTATARKFSCPWWICPGGR